MGYIGIRELMVLAVILVVWIGGAIARKAGYSRWYSLLLLVPLVNVVVVWIFAFSKWPALEKEGS